MDFGANVIQFKLIIYLIEQSNVLMIYAVGKARYSICFERNFSAFTSPPLWISSTLSYQLSDEPVPRDKQVNNQWTDGLEYLIG